MMKMALINVVVAWFVPSHSMFEPAGFHAEHLLVRECYIEGKNLEDIVVISSGRTGG
jgi:hypothetical protein